MSVWIDDNGYWHETGEPAPSGEGDAPAPATPDVSSKTPGTGLDPRAPGSWWGRLDETAMLPSSGSTARTDTGGAGPASGRPSGGISDWGAQFHAPTWTPPDPFSYASFTAPTAEEAASRPGYQFAAGEGKKALETSQAASGLYRTGGSLKDLYSWADKFATQNYNNVFGQDLSVYTTNRNNAAQNWLSNYNASRDAFDRTYSGALAEFAPQNQYNLLDFQRQWDEYQAQLNAATTIAGYGA